MSIECETKHNFSKYKESIRLSIKIHWDEELPDLYKCGCLLSYENNIFEE